MAKQTFTTGQVLTAAQLTSLQQTAMSGGAASAKTASYTLVAADAGTAISMTSTSATTITVNTGLFAAGDTVFIQNLGTGNLTITAGTATVNTAGSLILPQYDAGLLYFVSASSAVFYDYIQVGATSPLTTKGDLYTFGTSDTRLAVGANGTTLVADSAEATGLKWAAASSGGLTLLSTTSLSGTSTSITGISGSYTNLLLQIIDGVKSGVGGVSLQFNSDTGSNYADGMVQVENSTAYPATNNTATAINIGACGTATAQLSKQAQDIMITNYTSTGTKTLSFTGNVKYASGAINFFTGSGVYVGTSAISSIQVNATGGGYTGGEIKIWGMK